MIQRYTRDEMAKFWTDEYRFQKMLDVEIAACEVLCEKGKIPKESLKNIKAKAEPALRQMPKTTL